MADNFFSNRGLWITLIWSSVWIPLHTWVIASQGFEIEIALTDSLAGNFFLAAICFLLDRILKFYSPGKANAMKLFPMSLVMAGIWLLVSGVVLSFLSGNENNYAEFLRHTSVIRFFIAFLVILSFILLSWIWNYLESRQEDEKRKNHLEKLAREAELTRLRQQLQPHFLFNSLNSISALITSRPEEAKSMIHQLSDFLRGTLKKDDQMLVPLSQEMRHLQLYLEIEKVRFGHRLETSMEYEGPVSEMMIPPLLLQPVMENAVKFGLYDTTGKVTIKVSSGSEDNMLVIKFENPFDPETSHPEGTGFGLDSIRRRLYLLFGRNDLLETKAENSLFYTVIKIPQNS